MILDPGALGSALMNSVRNGDTPETLKLLQAGANPDAERDARGNTALHLAALHGQDDIARALVDAGACTEALTKDDRTTPLRLAAERGHLRTVQVLLDAAVNMEAEDALDRATPLHAAAEAGHTSVVEELVRRGANIEARASSGQTPLRWALSLGRAGTARVLLQLGADPDAPDRLGACCLHAVAGLVSEPICNDSEWEPVGESTSLSSLSSSAMMAELLLASGASVGRARCRPPLSPPLDNEDDVVGVDVANAHFGGETPLHIASRESSLQVVKVLLENGADPNARTCAEKGGFSPLHSAAAPGSGSTSRSVVRVLLEAGADVDSVAADGMTTPLRLACQNAAVGCVEELLRWDAYDTSLTHPSSSVPSSHTPVCASYNGTGLQTPAGPPFHPDAPPDEMGGAIRGAPPPLSAVVGSRVPLSVKDPEDEKRIHDLLRMAPYDRAWRRRGWLVMLNARAFSGTIEQRRRIWDCQPMHSAAYGQVQKRLKRPEPPISCEMSGWGDCDLESTGGVFEMYSDDTERRKRQEFRRLVRLLVGIQGDEAVFRHIVLWL